MISNKLNKFCFFALLTALFACNGQARVGSSAFDSLLTSILEHDVVEITVSELDTVGTLYLDARTKKEFDISHIQGAYWVGYEDFDIVRLSKIDKDSKLVVYCSVGYRSEKITERLLLKGYSDVSNLYGGIFEWVNEGNTVVDSLNKLTNNIHAYNRKWGFWLLKGDKVY